MMLRDNYRKRCHGNIRFSASVFNVLPGPENYNNIGVTLNFVVPFVVGMLKSPTA